MHYYQFNIGDYKSHTDYLSPMEDLAYRRMLDWCYLHEKPLPLSPEEIARKIGLRDCVEEIKLVLCDFFEKTDDGYINQRISDEIEVYKSKADAARRNGKKGGRPRKKTEDKPKKTNPVNLANQEETESKAKQEPITKNQEPRTINQEINKDIVEKSRLCLEYLNSVTGSKYRASTKSHIQNISARLSEGFTVEDLKMVIDAKNKEWGNDSKMCQFLRPCTLFSAKNFNGYLAMAKAGGVIDFRNPTSTQDYTQGW